MSIAESLRCPRCSAPLIGGSNGFACATHGIFSRDSNGIIRFLQPDDEYFAHHWDACQNEPIPTSKLRVAEAFLSPLLSRPRSADERTCWFDVGTGNGVHLSVISERAANVEMAGLDISYPALVAAARQAPGSFLMLADGLNIPVRDGAVDATFSYGVVAYTPDPRRAISEMVRITKPNGLIGLWVAPARDDFLGASLHILRSIVSRLGPFAQARIADLIVPFLGLLPTASGLNLKNASWRACREVVLVNIAPPRLAFLRRDDIVRHFATLGCGILTEDDTRPITIWAVRSSDRGGS